MSRAKKIVNLVSIITHPTNNDLYSDYKEKNQNNPVNRKFYEEQFHSLNLSIKRPNKDTCMTCDRLTMANKIKNQQDITNELQIHQAQADLAYSMKAQDKVISKNDEKLHTITFDMQQCLPTPVISSSLAFYKRQLWTYNLTIHDCDNGQGHCFIWNETLANRGGNDIASCVYKYLINLSPNIKHVTMYSDTCGGQNKNSYMAVMCLVALRTNPNLQTIDHKFLIPGHTHMECDTDHSVIEQKKKKFNGAIEHPHDWAILIRQCGKKKPMMVTEMKRTEFFDFAALLKGPLQNKKQNTTGGILNWRQVKWLHYEKLSPYSLFYKTELDNLEYLEVKLNKKGKSNVNLIPKNAYDESLAISNEKKKRLNRYASVYLFCLS